MWGRQIKVFTDHQDLRWVFTLDDPTGRLSRWALRLQDLDSEIKYKKGRGNVIADRISRLPAYGLTDFEPEFDLSVLAVGPSSAPAYPRRIDTATWSEEDWNLANHSRWRYTPECRDSTISCAIPCTGRR